MHIQKNVLKSNLENKAFLCKSVTVITKTKFCRVFLMGFLYSGFNYYYLLLRAHNCNYACKIFGFLALIIRACTQFLSHLSAVKKCVLLQMTQSH